LLALFAGCGGASQNPPGPANLNQLACLVTLEAECCPSGGPEAGCIGNFAAAEQCSSWEKNAVVAVFPAPCEGMTAVRAVLNGNSYATFFVYDANGALSAIGDNATSSASSDALECGAGPSNFVIPSACAATWVGAAGSVACTSGTVTATSICR
jgi:hypothetical protein